MRLRDLSIRAKSQFNILDFLVVIFWWLVRFPGVAHSDTSTQIDLMQNGQVTNQWTLAWYFLVKLVTFNGNTLAFLTLLQLLVGSMVLRRVGMALITVFPKSYLGVRVLMWSPIFGYLATTINHDFLAACGTILIFIAIYEAVRSRSVLSRNLVFASAILSSFSYISLFGLLSSLICYSVLQKSYRSFFLVFLFSLASLVNFVYPGLTSTGMNGISLVSDIKCASEDPSTIFDLAQKKQLESLAPMKFWTTAQSYSCASSNQVFSEIDIARISNKDLITLWVKIGVSNPGSYIKAHLIKAGFALPPPFVDKPSELFHLNSNDLNTRHNVEFLLMDRSQSAHGFSLLQPVQDIADLLAFQFNLLTGWLSWAGLWLLFILVTVILRFHSKRIVLKPSQFALISSPLVASHLFVFLASPLSEARYLLGTILLGLVILLNLMFEKYAKFFAEG